MVRRPLLCQHLLQLDSWRQLAAAFAAADEVMVRALHQKLHRALAKVLCMGGRRHTPGRPTSNQPGASCIRRPHTRTRPHHRLYIKLSWANSLIGCVVLCNNNYIHFAQQVSDLEPAQVNLLMRWVLELLGR
jgi:hypothetical protein